MSKIAEKKALEVYPPENGTLYQRLGYVKGYDRAMQDFLEKTEKFFNKELFTRFNGSEYRVASNKCMNLQQFIEQFKNYMQDEI